MSSNLVDILPLKARKILLYSVQPKEPNLDMLNETSCLNLPRHFKNKQIYVQSIYLLINLVVEITNQFPHEIHLHSSTVVVLVAAQLSLSIEENFSMNHCLCNSTFIFAFVFGPIPFFLQPVNQNIITCSITFFVQLFVPSS